MFAPRLSLAHTRVGSSASVPDRGLDHRRTASVLLVALCILGGCKEAAEPAKVAALVGLPASDSIRLGKTASYVVETRDASGNKLTGRKITWSSVSPNIATVDANGVVTGIAFGSTVISARADDITAQ